MFRRCYPHGDLKVVSLRSSNLAAKMSIGTAICNRNRGKGPYKPGKTDTVERNPPGQWHKLQDRKAGPAEGLAPPAG